MVSICSLFKWRYLDPQLKIFQGDLFKAAVLHSHAFAERYKYMTSCLKFKFLRT